MFWTSHLFFFLNLNSCTKKHVLNCSVTDDSGTLLSVTSKMPVLSTIPLHLLLGESFGTFKTRYKPGTSWFCHLTEFTHFPSQHNQMCYPDKKRAEQIRSNRCSRQASKHLKTGPIAKQERKSSTLNQLYSNDLINRNDDIMSQYCVVQI